MKTQLYTTNWNKYQSKALMERNNHFLDYLTDPCFQGVNRLFFLFYPLKIVHIEQGTENIFFQKWK